MQFVQAQRSARPLRIALGGPAGSGKTFSSLLILRGLTNALIGPEARIGVIDTENQSSTLYAGIDDIGKFGVLPLNDHSPEGYIEAMRVAVAANLDAVVIDSISHEWTGQGGILSIVDELASEHGDKHRAWGPAGKRHQEFVNALIHFPKHLIVTLRSKTSYERQKDHRGRTKIVKMGMQPIQRDGTEYEFDFFGQMDDEHNLYVHKSRVSFLDGGETVAQPGLDLGQRLAGWLRNEAVDAPETVEIDDEPLEDDVD